MEKTNYGLKVNTVNFLKFMIIGEKHKVYQSTCPPKYYKATICSIKIRSEHIIGTHKFRET